MANAHRKTPNFFLGLQLCYPTFQDRIITIQEELLKKAPELSKCMVSARKLHITFFVMCLQSADDLATAQAVLSESGDIVQSAFSSVSGPLVLQFTNSEKTLGMFGKKVLYANPDINEVSEAIINLRTLLYDRYKNALPYALIESAGFVPHVTIAKTSADRSRRLEINSILIEDLHGVLRDLQIPLSSIDLLSMAETNRDTGYYKSYECIAAAIMDT